TRGVALSNKMLTGGKPMSFVRNIQEVRARARRNMEQGPVTQDYQLDRRESVNVLNEALATEIMCVLRYRFHYVTATGIHSAAVAEEFLENAQQEEEHADELSDLLFAISPTADSETRRLYFADEVPNGQDRSDAGFRAAQK